MLLMAALSWLLFRRRKVSRPPVPGMAIPLAPGQLRPVQFRALPKADLVLRRRVILDAAREGRSRVGFQEERAEVEESSSEPSVAAAEEDGDGDVASELRPSHELYAGFMPQAKKLYDMLGYAYELVPDGAREPDRGGDENELLRDIFVSSASNVSEFVPRHLGDWNERFQRAVEGMSKLTDTNDPNVSLTERIRVGRDLINLSQDFIHLSTMYGRVIISEAFLPDEQKTIRPTKIGGVAGIPFVGGVFVFFLLKEF